MSRGFQKLKEQEKKRKRGHVGWEDELWELRFSELKEFAEREGHTRVPARWQRNPSLGRWLSHQRELARQDDIEPDRARRLVALGVEWSIRHLRASEAHESHLEYMLGRLAAHVEKHGHAGVDRHQDYELARWIQRQRMQRKTGEISERRIRRLTEAGFPWEHVDPLWERRYRELEEFHHCYGHVLVPANWEPNPSLGRWLCHQREIVRRGGQLAPGHQARLEALGVGWEQRIPVPTRLKPR